MDMGPDIASETDTDTDIEAETDMDADTDMNALHIHGHFTWTNLTDNLQKHKSVESIKF